MSDIFRSRSLYADKSGDHALVDTNLYIGNRKSVDDKDFLIRSAIALIVNASNREANLSSMEIPTIMVLDIEDIVPPANQMAEYRESVLSKANSVCEQIHKYVTNGRNVLVHCQAGVNRSAFILATYMITKRGHPPHTAVKMIKDANASQRDTVAFTNPILENLALTMTHSKIVALGVRCPNCSRGKFAEQKNNMLVCVYCRHTFKNPT